MHDCRCGYSYKEMYAWIFLEGDMCPFLYLEYFPCWENSNILNLEKHEKEGVPQFSIMVIPCCTLFIMAYG